MLTRLQEFATLLPLILGLLENLAIVKRDLTGERFCQMQPSSALLVMGSAPNFVFKLSRITDYLASSAGGELIRRKQARRKNQKEQLLDRSERS